MGKWINRFLNLLIILTILIILVIIYTAVTTIKHDFEPNFNISHQLWQVESGQYDSLLESYYQDVGFYRVDPSEKNQALEQLAVYVDSVFWEHIYQENHLSEKAEQETRRKKEAASGLGIFSGEQKKIDQLYGRSHHEAGIDRD